MKRFLNQPFLFRKQDDQLQLKMTLPADLLKMDQFQLLQLRKSHRGDNDDSRMMFESLCYQLKDIVTWQQSFDLTSKVM